MTGTVVRYRERLHAPWWLWVVVALLVASLGLAFSVAVGPLWSLLLTVVAGALAAWGLLVWAAIVEVTDTEFRAGRARIPLPATGPAVPLDAERAAFVRGPGIDPSAYHLIRGWVPTAVLVEVADAADPTPYWFVSSRDPAALVAALDAARADRR